MIYQVIFGRISGMKNKVIEKMLVFGLALTLFGMSGCGNNAGNAQPDQAAAEQSTEQTADQTAEEQTVDQAAEDPAEGTGDLIEEEEQPIEEDEEAGTGAEDASTSEEESDEYGAYLDKVNELKADGLADQFTLVNIDEDDIPELVASDSNGSFDHENAFIFTIHNDEVVQLAAVIAGVDGGNLDYAEGKNLIHVSGAAGGMREVFSKITDGKLEEVFTAEATWMDENAEYSVNGSSVKEDEYYKQINEFLGSYNPMTRIAYDGLYEVTYKYDNGYGGFEQGSAEKY